jgi:plasmid stability protein
MANLTITIDDDLLRQARIRALEQGTSVNALLREYLTAFAGAGDAQGRALADLLALSSASAARRGSETWTRDDLHDRGTADAPSS